MWFFFLWGELPRSKTKSWVVSVLLCSVLGQLCGLVHGLPVCGSFHSKNKLTFFPSPFYHWSSLKYKLLQKQTYFFSSRGETSSMMWFISGLAHQITSVENMTAVCLPSNEKTMRVTPSGIICWLQWKLITVFWSQRQKGKATVGHVQDV